eukprot:gene9631-12968_t
MNIFFVLFIIKVLYINLIPTESIKTIFNEATEVVRVSGFSLKNKQAKEFKRNVNCSPFSVSNTQFSQSNFASCSFDACKGDTIHVPCPTQSKGDLYVRLLSAKAVEVEYDDVGKSTECGYYASVTYTATQHCQKYILAQGCYADDACQGVYSISITSLNTGNTIDSKNEENKSKIISQHSSNDANRLHENRLESLSLTDPTATPTSIPSPTSTYELSEVPTMDFTSYPSTFPTSNPTISDTNVPSSITS